MADQDLWRKNIPEDFQGKMADEWDGEIPMSPLLWSSVAIVISFVIAVFFCWWLMDGVFETFREKPTPSPIAEANERRLPARPWVQPSPELELDEWEEIEQARIDGYGWVEELDGTVHIPVEKAMEMVLAAKSSMPASVEPATDGPVDVEAQDSEGEEASSEDYPATEPAVEDHGGSAEAGEDHGGEDHAGVETEQ